MLSESMPMISAGRNGDVQQEHENSRLGAEFRQTGWRACHLAGVWMLGLRSRRRLKPGDICFVCDNSR
jgi:hypothetical protein